MHDVLSRASVLSDPELLRQVVGLAENERAATVELVGHLAELDARKLHLAQGYGSLFAYCTGALRLAEHAAYNRIEAARLARRFPAFLDLLADGSLNLSTARLLSPLLRPENFEIVVAQARGRSKREVEVLVARLSPRPDVAPLVRRLPVHATVASVPARVVSVPVPPDPSDLAPNAPSLETAAGAGVPAPAASDSRGLRPSRDPVSPDAARSAPRPDHRPAINPLAPERYRVQFTIDAATHENLRRAQDLLRREVPDGDPGVIFGRALTLLLEDVARRKLALTEKPRSGTGRPDPPYVRSRHNSGRHVPAPVKRAVWMRDGGRCAFVASSGRRCTERAFLEFHHREPYAVGGEATAANISLRCRAHNVYEAVLAFGSRGRELAPGRAVLGARPAPCPRPASRASPSAPPPPP